MTLFPAELKSLAQWCVATLIPGADGKEDKAPYNPVTGKRASTTDPTTWGTFEQAITTRDAWRSTNAPRAQIGFIFNEHDPFSVIDLDTYKVTDPEIKDTHANILAESQTYAELSQSGFGTHIIGLGNVPDGINSQRNSMEVYSRARFMICTGNAVGGLVRPLADIQELLDFLHQKLKKAGPTGRISWRDLDDGEESGMSDQEVLDRCERAENADKFIRLCQGDMSDYNGDHSDADAALIQFLCFHTPDNNQVRRLFMMSALGERDKAQRPDYVPRTILFSREKLASEVIPTIDATAIADRARAAALPAPQAVTRADDVVAPATEPEAVTVYPVEQHVVTFPPGLIGELAEYVMTSAPRPVREIALATAIAVVAGIAGRNYNVSNTGLNQYILLLAKTGTGKESVQSSVDRLILEVQKKVAAADRFIGPAHFASGQALVKTFQDRPCFMSVLGEFGHRLQAMAHPRANSAEKTLMAAMLDIFGKSGWGQMLRPSVYSDKEKNTALVHAPAMTILGEAEPEGFFASLDENTISSGFLPRFLVIEYRGERPRRNRNAWAAPPADLVTKVSDLCTNVLSMEQGATCAVVGIEVDALRMLDKFDEFADEQMRGSSLVTQLLWNRGHLKALRLAALVAVGVNPYAPTVTQDIALWAIDMVRADI